MSKIFLAADHQGFELKEYLKLKLSELPHSIIDCGAETLQGDDDYPNYVSIVAKNISIDSNARGIVIGSSGQGEAIAANRFKNVRAVVYYGESTRLQTDAEGNKLDLITSTRAHNDANVLSLGASFISKEEAWDVVQKWLTIKFSEAERHVRRIKKLDD